MRVCQEENKILILSLYVDDILLAGNDLELIVATKEWLSSTFEMKDMGQADYVLGSRDRSKRLLSLSQETYIKWFRMHNSKPVDTPMEKGLVLSAEQSPKTEEEKRQMAFPMQAQSVV